MSWRGLGRVLWGLEALGGSWEGSWPDYGKRLSPLGEDGWSCIDRSEAFVYIKRSLIYPPRRDADRRSGFWPDFGAAGVGSGCPRCVFSFPLGLLSACDLTRGFSPISFDF